MPPQGAAVAYLRYVLEDVVVRSVRVAGTAGQRAEHTVALAYTRIEQTYSELDGDGRPVGAVQQQCDKGRLDLACFVYGCSEAGRAAPTA
mgnify:CR=1 FL=1